MVSRLWLCGFIVDKQGVGRVQIVQGSGTNVIHDFSVPFRCKTKKDAIELVSTFSLYNLVRGGGSGASSESENNLASIQELLPPAFRSYYNGMIVKEEERRLEVRL